MKYLFVPVFCVLSYASFAQVSSKVPQNVRATNTLDALNDNGLMNTEILYGIPLAPGEVVGDEFLKDEWQLGTIVVKESEKRISGVPCKYNIATQTLLVRDKAGQVRAVSIARVKSFEVQNGSGEVSLFVNAQSFSHDGAALDGVLEVLSSGSHSFYKRTEIVVIQPTYKHEFSTGSRDTKLVKRDSYFTAVDKNLVKLNTKSVKKLVKSAGALGSQISAYASQNQFDPNNERDLKALFESINSN
jgi:hypothetical protein